MTDINKKNGTVSVISNHRLEHKHEFNWEDIKILDTEPSYQKRIISEMVYIKNNRGA